METKADCVARIVAVLAEAERRRSAGTATMEQPQQGNGVSDIRGGRLSSGSNLVPVGAAEINDQ
ncbi:hypothetical protein TSH58_05270 [Azospirillum sp. TSH58]|nr:hypothetical protein TSH58_05270 [Azospirillum sp. TSH58]